MELKDLRNGYVVELRSGERMMVIKDFVMDQSLNKKDVFYNAMGRTWDSFESYKEDMRNKDFPEDDVIKVIIVRTPTSNQEIVIWERKEDKTDWSKIEKDTLIWVKGGEMEEWIPRYFAKYEDGKVYAYPMGRTSFTSIGEQLVPWENAKLKKED